MVIKILWSGAGLELGVWVRAARESSGPGKYGGEMLSLSRVRLGKSTVTLCMLALKTIHSKYSCFFSFFKKSGTSDKIARSKSAHRLRRPAGACSTDAFPFPCNVYT